MARLSYLDSVDWGHLGETTLSVGEVVQMPEIRCSPKALSSHLPAAHNWCIAAKPIATTKASRCIFRSGNAYSACFLMGHFLLTRRHNFMHLNSLKQLSNTSKIFEAFK